MPLQGALGSPQRRWGDAPPLNHIFDIIIILSILSSSDYTIVESISIRVLHTYLPTVYPQDEQARSTRTKDGTRPRVAASSFPEFPFLDKYFLTKIHESLLILYMGGGDHDLRPNYLIGM